MLADPDSGVHASTRIHPNPTRAGSGIHPNPESTAQDVCSEVVLRLEMSLSSQLITQRVRRKGAATGLRFWV